MSLPDLSIPVVHLPFEIPAMMHPFLVHFAVAIPLLIILLELANLLLKNRTVGITSFVFMILAAVALYVAYVSGEGDAGRAGTGGELLAAHRTAGIYLVYGSLLLLAFKLLNVLIRKTPMRIVFLLFLVFFTGVLFDMARKGEQLVCAHGAGSEVSGGQKTVPAVAEKKSSEESAPVAKSMKIRENNLTEASPAPASAEKAGEVSSPQAESNETAPSSEAANNVSETDHSPAPEEKKNEE